MHEFPAAFHWHLLSIVERTVEPTANAVVTVYGLTNSARSRVCTVLDINTADLTDDKFGEIVVSLLLLAGW